MFKRRALLFVATTLATVAGAFTSASWGFDNTNMQTSLHVEGGYLVVRWVQEGYGHYNIRWQVGGGSWKQVEREGDKYFRYVSVYRPNVVYRVAVQGCDKPNFSRSKCTSWDEQVCGNRGNPCR